MVAAANRQRLTRGEGRTHLAVDRVLITGGYDLVGAVIADEAVFGTLTYKVSVEFFDPKQRPGWVPHLPLF